MACVERICANLDAHLVAAALETSKAYQKQFFSALEKTNMIDFRQEKQRELGVAVNPRDETQRTHVLAALADAEKVSKQLLLGLEDEKVVEESVLAAESLSQLYYSCGLYDKSLEILNKLKKLDMPEHQMLAVSWGHLACSILLGEADEAISELTQLRDLLDASSLDKFSLLKNRSWLLHWSLFVFFFLSPNEDSKPSLAGPTMFLDFVFQDKYMNALQTTNLHLLPYVIFSVVVLNRSASYSRRNVLSEVKKIVRFQNESTSSDPFVGFFSGIFMEFDFQVSLKNLHACGELLKQDPFLGSYRHLFLEEASVLYFEAYCRVHEVIDVALVQEIKKIDGPSLSVEQAKAWVNELIRQNRIDAKIHSDNRIIVDCTFPSLHQKVIDRTKAFASRSAFMLAALDRVVDEQDTPNADIDERLERTE
jgi:translation initiation factor 3 subunit E